MGARSDRWNRSVYAAVVDAHRRLGMDLNDPATTWRWSAFGPPKNANHEADAPNRWHLAVLALVSCVLAWRGLRGRDRERALYALSLACAFIAFCGYLKWQPFLARLFLPLFVLGAPLTGIFGEIGNGAGWRSKGWLVQMALCLLLLDNARHPALDNWVRPLRGPGSVLRTPRADQYFADMSQWNNAGTYRKTADFLGQIRCSTVGVDITNLQLEYPLQALLREKRPGTRFLHTGVRNVSTRYPPPVDAPPCAVVCLDCAGDPARLAFYTAFEKSAVIDRFAIFWRE